MTDPALRTTYRRADGTKKFVGDVYGEWFTNEPPADWIEEQWDGDRLVRYRTIRLGADEKCDWKWCRGASNRNADDICPQCNDSGVKPRDTDTQWTEAEKT